MLNAPAKSMCIYCGVGCRLNYLIEGNKIVKTQGDTKDRVSTGTPCIKGLTISETAYKNRHVSPQIRVNGKLKTVGWSEAYQFIYNHVKNLAPQEIFFSGSGKITNEDNFVIQEFARVVIKTNNVDSCCGRLCHAPTVMAVKDCLGTANATRSENLSKVDCLLIVGSNPASNYPVFWTKVIREKAKRNFPIIVIAPMWSLSAKQIKNTAEDQILIVEPGCTVALINGLINELLKRGLYDQQSENFEGFTRLKRVASKYPLEKVAEIARVSKEQLLKAADKLAASQRLGVFHGMGLTQHVNGIENIHTLLNLMLLKNGFILTLRGEINVQGAGDVISLIPQQAPLAKGQNIIEAFCVSPVKAAFISGFNPAQSLPNLNETHRHLEKMFLVVMESHRNLTSEFANVILPTPMLFEREGSITNGERLVRKVNRVTKPLGQAKPEWLIYKELSRLWGKEIPYNSEKEILERIVRETPAYEKLDVEKLYQGNDQFADQDILWKRFYPEEFEGLDDPRSNKYPFLLTSFRSPHSFLTGEITSQSVTLQKGEKEPGFYISPKDAESIGIANGEIIEVESIVGKLQSPAQINQDVPAGVIGASYHSPKLLLNILFPLEFDEESFTPNYKATAVRVRKVES